MVMAVCTRARDALGVSVLGRPTAVATCPKCEHPEAYFHQMQIRSADEPSTTFYTCANPECGHKWNEG